MGLGLIQQSFLQHIISKLQLFCEGGRLEQLALVAGEDLLQVALGGGGGGEGGGLVQVVGVGFEVAALEGFAHFQLEVLEQFQLILVLGGQKLIPFVDLIDFFCINSNLLLYQSISRFNELFSFLKLAKSFLNVLFCFLSKSISFIQSVTKGPMTQLTAAEIIVNFLSKIEKSMIQLDCEMIDKCCVNSDCLGCIFLVENSGQTHFLLTLQSLKSSIICEICFSLSLSFFSSLILALLSDFLDNVFNFYIFGYSIFLSLFRCCGRSDVNFPIILTLLKLQLLSPQF